MKEPEIKVRNAQIDRAEIVYDTQEPRIEITLNYGSATQQTGSLKLTENLVHLLLQITHSTLWSEVVGKPVRAKCTREKIFRIGDFLTDDWIDLSKPDVDDMPH